MKIDYSCKIEPVKSIQIWDGWYLHQQINTEMWCLNKILIWLLVLSEWNRVWIQTGVTQKNDITNVTRSHPFLKESPNTKTTQHTTNRWGKARPNGKWPRAAFTSLVDCATLTSSALANNSNKQGEHRTCCKLIISIIPNCSEWTRMLWLLKADDHRAINKCHIIPQATYVDHAGQNWAM